MNNDGPNRVRWPARQRSVTESYRREALSTIAVVVATVGVLTALSVANRGEGGSTGDAVAAVGQTPAAAAAQPAAAPPAGAVPDVDVVDPSAPAVVAQAVASDCRIEAESLRPGDAGTDVTCLQQALVRTGFLQGEPTGAYDNATFAAVEALQNDRDLFVDGITGRETALSVDVWRDEQQFVVRTPPPAPGTVDEMGFELSSVSSIGADVPPLPANSGSGRRVVYSRAEQRAWAVADDGHVIRSWLVAGSKYNNELPGQHEVYSRSEQSTAWNGKAILPYMIRWQKTDIGAIGFHGIPIHVEDGSKYMTEAELGARLSGGCQRQADADALFMWNFADVGTTVYVL